MATRNYQGSSYFNADGSRKKHKYIARKKVGTNPDGTDRFQYFYTQAELNAAKGTAENSAKPTATPAKTSEGSIKSTAQSVVTISQSALGTAISTVHNFLSNLTKTAPKIVRAIDRAVDKAKDVTASTWNKAKDATSSAMDTVQKYLSQPIFTDKREVTSSSVTSGYTSKYNSSTATIKQSYATINMTDDHNYVYSAETVAEHPALDYLTTKKTITPTSTDERYADLEVKTDASSAYEDMKAVNPNYNTKSYTYTNNCARCSLAYELQQRGYDVCANPYLSYEESTINDQLEWYENADGTPVEDYDQWVDYDDDTRDQVTADLKEYLLSQGDGARGKIGVTWVTGGGHSINYEVHDGEVLIVDSQASTVDTLDNTMQYATSIRTLRTDDKEISAKGLSMVHNASDDYKYADVRDPINDGGCESYEDLYKFYNGDMEAYQKYLDGLSSTTADYEKAEEWLKTHKATTSVVKK